MRLLSSGLIDCYLASNGIREAMGMANNIYNTLGANAQTLTILATVCLEDPVTQEKAKTLLDKALAQRPDYTKAVVKKAELLSMWLGTYSYQLLCCRDSQPLHLHKCKGKDFGYCLLS